MSTNEIPQFNPAIGSPVLIQPAGFEGKLKTIFVGMDTGQYIIASLTPFINDIENISKYLERGRKTRIFYTRNGVVSGYRVQIQGYTTSPQRHLYLTYPHKAESYNLRGHDRIVCHLPAVIIGLGISAKCLVQNLSTGGCGICLDPSDKDQLNNIDQSDYLELRLQLTTMTGKIATTCQLMGLRETDGLDIARLRFIDIPDQAVTEIKHFISFVVDHRV